jgi:hypothetical protein
MFSVTYTKKGNKVVIEGYNPLNNSTFEGILEFNNPTQSQGFVLGMETLEAAVKSSYNGRFAIAYSPEELDITTETTLNESQYSIIHERISKTLEIFPISKHVVYHSVS